MKKFEVGKIYREKEFVGCAYDSNAYYYYYKITRRTDSTIWFNVYLVQYEAWGSPILTEDQADHLGLTAVNSENCTTGKARVSLSRDTEDFKFDNDYHFIKYMKEFNEVK